jgi:hypothetical protein
MGVRRPQAIRELACGLLLATLLLLSAASVDAQKFDFTIRAEDIPCGRYDNLEPIVWYGNDTRMTLAQLAAYCAPVLWFSPDEPLLADSSGKGILIPEAFPFEENPGAPVVYYRVRTILQRVDAVGPAYDPVEGDRPGSVVDLSRIAGVDLDYFFYYSTEAGLGGHKHDVESAHVQAAVWRRDSCETTRFHLVVYKVIGKAHGLQWYDNTLGVDEYARFPIHLLVEEGKHATCTDKNADGYYTPAYDVNRRVNDAWGVRDVIRSGALFTGNYQSWMTKVRRPQHRVFPPLPEDSPLRRRHTRRGVYAPDNAIYEMRPFPPPDQAPPDLVHFIADKGDPNWPEVAKNTGTEQFARWVGSESFVKSLSVALYADGDLGVSGVFPLFIVKNFEEPMTGGFLTNRIILKDKHLRDFSWMLHYTPSASRWIDGYLSAGWEWDEEDAPAGSSTETEKDDFFVFETGIKFRVNLTHSPLKLLTAVTDFWGFRAGIKNDGFFDIERLRYVLEFGAGTW